jgi:lysyl-tRNA synthetase class 2
MYKTVAGEWTIQVEKCYLLTKAINQLPEKWAGIKNEETSLRYRFIDFIQNKETREVFFIRNKIINSIRNFLTQREFMEVETPILQNIASGAAATPFETHHNALNMKMYLRIAPELFLKRMIIAGYNRVFEMGKCFRNEGIDPTHLQEFTMLETYEAYQTYDGLQNYAIDLLQYIVRGINEDLIVNNINFQTIPRVAYFDLMGEYLNFDKIDDKEYLIDIAKKHNLEYADKKTTQALIDLIYKKLCVHNIIDPVLVYDYPRSALSMPHKDKPHLAQQFQIVVCKQEIIKACVEQNDPFEQEKEFNKQEEFLKEGDDEVVRNDISFIDALKYGMPPTSGLGMGIDRLTRILTGTDSIRNVVFFPMVRNKT